MRNKLLAYLAATVYSCLFLIGTAQAQLSLQQAEQMALEYDAELQIKRARSGAFKEESVAADTLPDPRLKLGLMNFPTDTFERDQEPMTQVQVGVQQMFPRGDSLQIKSRQALQSSQAMEFAASDRERKIRLDVRKAYLDLLFWLQSEEVVRNNIRLFSQLVEITQSQYAAGIQRQQDVIHAELELGMLNDRLDAIRTNQGKSRARLSKLIGIDKPGQLVDGLPVMPALPSDNQWLGNVEQHPLVQMEASMVARSLNGIELAKQAYKPDWMLDLTYGFRDGNNPNGSERADFLSAMVSIDLPLFTGDKQDRTLAASRHQHYAAMQAREERLRKLKSQLQSEQSDWETAQQRINRFHKIIVPQSEENAKAALYAYQNRRGNFNSLMRARITELETKLKFLKLRISYLKSQAQLLYLVGEGQ